MYEGDRASGNARSLNHKHTTEPVIAGLGAGVASPRRTGFETTVSRFGSHQAQRVLHRRSPQHEAAEQLSILTPAKTPARAHPTAIRAAAKHTACMAAPGSQEMNQYSCGEESSTSSTTPTSHAAREQRAGTWAYRQTARYTDRCSSNGTRERETTRLACLDAPLLLSEHLAV